MKIYQGKKKSVRQKCVSNTHLKKWNQPSHFRCYLKTRSFSLKIIEWSLMSTDIISTECFSIERIHAVPQ